MGSDPRHNVNAIANLIPPPSLMEKIGSPSAALFQEIGQEFLDVFIRHAGIKRTDRVLDIGCGCGRMALPLTRYLTQGSYEGFDISEDAVRWCQMNITTKMSNFRFQWVNLANSVYNPSGMNPEARFRFPYPHQEFDFIFLTSVFTHMLPNDVRLYMQEIARTLKRNGRVVATFFILNEESEQLMKTHLGPLSFAHSYANGQIRVQNPTEPEEAVAYPELTVRGMLRKSGLTLAQPIHFGSWCRRSATVTYQDLLILTRSSTWLQLFRFFHAGLSRNVGGPG